MTPKGGTLVLLLIVACAAMGKSPDFKDMAKKLMRKCQEQGYPLPKMNQLRTVFNSSDSPMMDRNSDQSNTYLSTFMKVLDSVYPVKNSLGRFPMDGKKPNKMWNCTDLTTMIKMMRNSSEASACYMRAFVAPQSWEALTTQSEDNMDSDDYDELLWAAKPALEDMPPSEMRLPVTATRQKVKKMMMVMQEERERMSEDKRKKVADWIKQQIAQNNFNCTMKPSSDSRLKQMPRCRPALKWLNCEAMDMIGQYLPHLKANDVDSSPKEELLECFRSGKLESAFRKDSEMKPSLAKRFLQKIQESLSQKDFEDNLERLGTLICHMKKPPKLTAELSSKLLPQLNACNDSNNPGIKKLKKLSAKLMMSNSNTAKTLLELGKSVRALPPKNLPPIAWDDLKLFRILNLTVAQQRAVVRQLMGEKKCEEVSDTKLMDLQPVLAGLPCCVVKRIKAEVILNETENLKQMSKCQLKAMLKEMRKDVKALDLVLKLDGDLLRSVPLRYLAKANITSSDEVNNKTWSQSQALLLVKKMRMGKLFKMRGLRSLAQGITSEMINQIPDSEVQNVTQKLTEDPKWLSRRLASWLAKKLFATLGKRRADFFKTITEEEMDEIPSLLLPFLTPETLTDLPDSVCDIFLKKMEEANMYLLPLSDRRSRSTLANKILSCLGGDVSSLTTESVDSFGPLLCEFNVSQLRQMTPDVLNASLQAMAGHRHFPRRNWMDLIQLVKETFGDPSDWSAETMEDLSPLLLLDDNAISALPNEPRVKDILFFLMPRLTRISAGLRKKMFDIITTTTTTSNDERKKRAANSGSSTLVPTVELIEELEMFNVQWTPDKLDTLSAETFRDTVETLGSVDNYSTDQLAVLSDKAAKVLGPVSQMTEANVMELGCITQGFSDADLEMLPFTSEALEDMARCGWNESQMEPVWKGFAKYNNLTAEQLDAADMVALGRFICGLNSSEIEQLDGDAFTDAVGSMDVQCSYKVMEHFKSLAASVFGVPTTWTSAQVSELKNIIAGLNATELMSLDKSVFSFISESCIPLIPARNFAALSVEQLQALGPDNIAVITSEQLAALSKDKREALEPGTTGSRDQTKTPEESGAPSMSVEGIASFMKPLLVLLTGFLLL
ncbi:otoancorin isoform X1 [Sparus aurata]|uniref:Otoancorin n=1 Tax=Sparus aurata TaxID=8175 RepID=A0A671X0E2_SPAAU|nr:otoancorin isoform X1 [Sparus aurata]XP_030249656.1 otoancorin isoform X1 [Sparus aurata]